MWMFLKKFKGTLQKSSDVEVAEEGKQWRKEE